MEKDFEQRISVSFKNVKKDFGIADSKLNELRKENLFLRGKIDQIERELGKTQQNFMEFIAGRRDEGFEQKIEQMLESLKKAEKREPRILTIQRTPINIPKTLTAKKAAKGKETKQRKNVVKEKILSLANEKSNSLIDIKEEIVDKQALCSKATFYRYFDEIKGDGKVEFQTVNRKKVVKPIEAA